MDTEKNKRVENFNKNLFQTKIRILPFCTDERLTGKRPATTSRIGEQTHGKKHCIQETYYGIPRTVNIGISAENEENVQEESSDLMTTSSISSSFSLQETRESRVEIQNLPALPRLAIGIEKDGNFKFSERFKPGKLSIDHPKNGKKYFKNKVEIG